MSETILSKQWTHGCYVKTPDCNVVVVKEKLITIDKETNQIVDIKNNLTWNDPTLTNPKRAIFVTKPQFRNHTYKKETEQVKNTDMYIVEDRFLIDDLKRIMDIPPYKRTSLRKICDSPYIYNADVGMEALIRLRYNNSQKHHVIRFTIGAFDIEVSVLGCGRINAVTYIHEDTIYTVALNDFMWKYVDGKKKKATANDIYGHIHNLFGPMPDKETIEITTKDKNGDNVKTRFKFHLKIAETELELIFGIFDIIHRCETDFINIWNIDYDIPKIIQRLEYYKVDPTDVFCHPSVPKHLRMCHYKRDKKKTHHIADKWHWLHCTSMSQFLDAMLLYSRIRKAKRKKSSYKLDAIAKEELGFGKLSFGEDDNSTLDHHLMQSTRFPEYVVYNIQDSILLQLMDRKNRDIVAMWNLSGDSTLADFSKQSVMLKNGYYKFAKEHDRVFATTGETMDGPFDHLLGKVGGAVLRADQCKDIGINCLVERPDLETMLLVFASDLDFKAIYPSFKSGFGISKETKLATCVEVQGNHKESIEALFGGLANPPENAVWICNDFLGLPNYEEMDALAEIAFGPK